MITREVTYEMPEMMTSKNANDAVIQDQLKKRAALVPLEFNSDIFDLLDSPSRAPTSIDFPDRDPLQNTYVDQIFGPQFNNSYFQQAVTELVTEYATPGGNDTEVQFNDAGAFAGDSALKWNKTTNVLTILGAIVANNFGSVFSTFFQLASTAGGSLIAFTTQVSTTNNTPTNVTLTGVGTNIFGIQIEVRVRAFRTGGSAGANGDCASYIRRATYKNIAGAVSIVGAVQDNYTAEDQPAWDLTLGVSGTNAVATITGETNNNITWDIVVLEVV